MGAPGRLEPARLCEQQNLSSRRMADFRGHSDISGIFRPSGINMKAG